MRIALFSDVHANLPALEACFASMNARQPDAIYCLGDLVGYNVWPNEVIDAVRRRGIPTIAGNYDRGIGVESDDCGCAYKTEEEKAMGAVSISYTNSVVGAEQRAYLRSLPAHIRLEFPAGDRMLHLVLVHGSPRRVNEYLFEDRDEKSLLRIMDGAGADILCFGHTHKPYHRVLPASAEGIPRYAVNTGSVGKPKDGDPRGCYVLLNIGREKEESSGTPLIEVEFVRFDYNIGYAAAAVEASPLPGEYAAMLRKGL